VNDNDLLFAVTLRSSKPDQALFLDDNDNNHLAFFAQDDWRVSKNLTLNLGLRYELDTNVNNNSWYANRNPLVQSFYKGDRKRDTNNFAPRIGFNWATNDGRTSLHGGYGIYYDRITLEIMSLERGLDGRALAIEVRAGNALTDPTGAPIYIDPATGQFRPGAPTFSNPFTGFILPGAGASGINIIDNNLQNPMVQQFDFGVQRELTRDFVARADYIHNFGVNFIIGRTIGVVNNPVVGGPDRVVNLESSVKTKYDGLLLSLEKRFSNKYQFRASYTLSKPLLHFLGRGRIALRLSAGADSDAGFGSSDGHSAARREHAHSGLATQRRRPPVQNRRRPQSFSDAVKCGGRRQRAAAAAGA
jgi:outer membrane receptor for Fe3+-dicitrate